MKESDRQALEAYLDGGRNHLASSQLHFLNRAPRPQLEVSSVPTRTFSQAVTEDFLPTAYFIRRTYIPNFNPIEVEGLAEAVKWVDENQEEFDLIHSTNKYDHLPWLAFINLNTLFFRNLSLEGLKEPGEKPAAYSPETQDWENDILRTTLGLFETLKLQEYEVSRKINMRLLSTSRTLRILTEFFWSGGKNHRLEGVDLLTAYLYHRYYTELWYRSRRKTQ